MIERFIKEGTSPKFDLLIIDEAQDLAPIQWKMVKEVLVPNSEEVYYAFGDDDQAIYSWMGVDVKHFLNASKIKILLEDSHRVPNHIHELAQNITDEISIREKKEWKPTKKKEWLHGTMIFLMWICERANG